MDYTQLDTPLDKTIQMVGFEIAKYVTVKLFCNATIPVVLYFKNGNKCWNETKIIELSQDEYNSWNNDDQYIINLVKSRLNELM